MLRTFATALTLTVLACSAACSSSSSVGGDASTNTIDVIAPELDSTLADASEETVGVDAGR